jgi:hypothetical protein
MSADHPANVATFERPNHVCRFDRHGFAVFQPPKRQEQRTVIRIWETATSDEEYTHAAILNLLDFREQDRRPLYRQSLAGRFPQTTVEIESAYPPSDYFNTGGFFMVSGALKSQLEGFGVDSEFFPVSIVYEGEPYTARPFFFANVRDEVECLDEVQGEYEYWQKPQWSRHVEKIRRLVLDEAKAAGHHLFFVARLSGPVFCASAELQE